jgi:hypothetical protein
MAEAKRAKAGPGEQARAERGLEVEEDLGFQRRDWRVQRVGWGLLGLLLLAGLIGLLGSGPLSKVTESDGRGLSVDYDRFVRHGAQTSLTLRIEPSSITTDEVPIRIGREYLAAQTVQAIVPAPLHARAQGDDLEFTFNAQPGSPLEVKWTLEPDEMGRHTGAVTVGEGPPVYIAQFTYP